MSCEFQPHAYVAPARARAASCGSPRRAASRVGPSRLRPSVRRRTRPKAGAGPWAWGRASRGWRASRSRARRAGRAGRPRRSPTARRKARWRGSDEQRRDERGGREERGGSARRAARGGDRAWLRAETTKTYHEDDLVGGFVHLDRVRDDEASVRRNGLVVVSRRRERPECRFFESPNRLADELCSSGCQVDKDGDRARHSPWHGRTRRTMTHAVLSPIVAARGGVRARVARGATRAPRPGAGPRVSVGDVFRPLPAEARSRRSRPRPRTPPRTRAPRRPPSSPRAR